MAQSRTSARCLAAALLIAAATTEATARDVREFAVDVDAAGVAHVGAGPGREAASAPTMVASTSPQAPAAATVEGAAEGKAGQGADQAKLDGVASGGRPNGSDRSRSACAATAAPSTAEAEALVRRVAQAEDFYPDFVLSVARIESHFRADQVSPKGAVGLMQLMPATAARYGVDICDPADNVRGGVRYLRALHDRYHNPFYMLAAYNAGEEAVEQYRGVPPFPETVRYVADVINDFYTLPPPGPKASAIAGKRTPTSRSIATAQPEAGWSQGFVMHVEN